MSFGRYPEYEDSGVEWLGEVPAHWETWKLSHAFGSIGSGTTPPSNESEWYDGGHIPWVTTGELRETVIFETGKSVNTAATKKFTTLRLHPVGSLAVAMYGATIGRLGILGVAATTNQACCVLSSPIHLNVQFVFYWLSGFKQNLIELYATGGGQPNISQDIVAGLRVPAPDLVEQKVIAAFLDRESAKIDALVAEQETLMALLKEKRQAVISHAVTKGLDATAPMKNSGVVWLGEVPTHWTVCSIRRVVSKIEQGWSPECIASPAEDNEWGILKAGCVNRGRYDQNENKALPSTLSPMPEYEVLAGDVLMSRANGSPELVGSTALIVATRSKLMLSDKIFRIHFELQIEPSFFVAALSSQPLRRQIEQSLSGGNGLANNLPQSSLLEFFLCVPPNEEQSRICDHIALQTRRIDELVEEAEVAITLLQERRTALITAAVTGQIDVRHLVTTRAPEATTA